jgi:hypothetical protein
MQLSKRSKRNVAANMIAKRFIAAASALSLGLALGSCSPFSGFVADHWPHWAGGMPDDVPPRPGTPGYAGFIAHGQPGKDAATNAASDDNTNAQAAPAQAQTPAAPAAPAQAAPAPAAPAGAAPPSAAPPNDPAAVHGGLY